MAPVLIGLSHGALFALAAPLHDGYLFCPPMPAGIQRKFGVSENRLRITAQLADPPANAAQSHRG